jgi:1-deoxy-D-xylulose-5-phosphate reductoisomerase
MRRPIGYLLAGARAGAVATLDLASVAQLSFERADTERFPALRLAMQALKQGSGAKTVLNAANEVAVEAFLANRIGFTAIPEIVEMTLTAADSGGLLIEPLSIDDALALDAAARGIARADLKRRSARPEAQRDQDMTIRRTSLES